MTWIKPRVPQVVDDANDLVWALPLGAARPFGLTQMARLVWVSAAGCEDSAEVTARVVRALEASDVDAQQVTEFLEQLVGARLLTWTAVS